MPSPSASPQKFISRQRSPLLVTAFLGATAMFVGLKMKAVFARSETAKDTAKEINYSVAPGRSGGGV